MTEPAVHHEDRRISSTAAVIIGPVMISSRSTPGSTQVPHGVPWSQSSGIRIASFQIRPMPPNAAEAAISNSNPISTPERRRAETE
jgi:hypothetical protein